MADFVTQVNRFTIPTEAASAATFPATGPVLWPPELQGPNLKGNWANATAAEVGDICSITKSSGGLTFDYCADAWKGRVGIIVPKTDVPGVTIATTYAQNDEVWVRELVQGIEVMTWENSHANAALAAGTAYDCGNAGNVTPATVGTDHVRFYTIEAKASVDTTDTPRSICVKFVG